ncbi:MAG: zinc-dependent alcohol dehydrogenase family protein [Chlamydiales bacterium]
MRAMVLTETGKPLQLKEIPTPQPNAEEVLIKVSVCGICRTDLHLIDGELPSPKLPIVPGHQIVGEIVALGEKVSHLQVGNRVGVPWLGGSCGQCEYCRKGQENLCDQAVYTGYQKDGGFAQFCVANARFTFPIPSSYPDSQAAPLLCAGLIGYRALTMTAGAKRIGFYGFGASAHILTQVVLYQGGEVYAFTRKGDVEKQAFAKKLKSIWAKSSEEKPPVLLDAVIIFAPIGELVPKALSVVKKGGVVVCAGIHMSDIPSFPYKLLWGERIIRSVSNLTRQDGEEFLTLAPKVPVQTTVTPYPLEKANEALDDLRNGRFSGAAIIDLSL